MKRIIDKILNMSILWKFTYIYFVLIIVPLAVFQVNGYYKSVTSIREQNFNILAQTVSQIKQNVLYMTKNCEYASDILRYDTQVQGFLGNDFEPVTYLDYGIEQKLSKISQVGFQHFDLFFYTVNTTIPEMDRIVYNLDRIKDSETYQDILKIKENSLWGGVKKKDYFYGAEDHKDDTKLYLPFYTKIKSLVINNLILGVLEIDLPLDEVTKAFSNVEIGKKGYLAVLDNTGTIVYNGGPLNISEYIKKNELKNNTGVISFDQANKKYNVVYDTIDDTGLKLLAVISEEEILSQVSSYKMSLWTILLLGVFFAFIVTYIITRFLFKRIRVLLNMMKRVENGEFDTRVVEYRNDEIGKLTYGFNSMTGKLEEILLQLVEKETAQWEAELRALQAQINPHFLYNTLESLKMECEMNQQYELSDALTSLGALFRYNIKWDSRIVTVSQEIEHVKNYVSVMKIRFSDQIELRIDIPDAFMGFTIPKLVLQPLVENCFSHSFKNANKKFTIEISSSMDNRILFLDITDNGIGIERDRVEFINQCLEKNEEVTVAKNNGVGLSNVNKRIKMQFGEIYGVSIISEVDKGTTVRLTLPVLDIQK